MAGREECKQRLSVPPNLNNQVCDSVPQFSWLLDDRNDVFPTMQSGFEITKLRSEEKNAY